MRGDPGHVGVEEEEEDHGDGHDIHVEREHDASVVQAPAWLYAAEGFKRAGEGNHCGEDQEKGATVLREVGDAEGEGQRTQYEHGTTQERLATEIEEGPTHAEIDYCFAATDWTNHGQSRNCTAAIGHGDGVLPRWPQSESNSMPSDVIPLETFAIRATAHDTDRTGTPQE